MALPPGLSLSPNGKLTGTPTTPGTYEFEVTATNPNGFDVSGMLTMVIGGGGGGGSVPAFVNETPPTTGVVGDVYDYHFTATGVPAPTFSKASGTFPPGTDITADGELSGTLTTAGSYAFVVQAHNDNGDAFTPLITVVVSPLEIPPTFTNQDPPDGLLGVAFSYTFTAVGDPAPTFSKSSGNFPTGLTLNATTGVLSGTPTATGPFTFVVQAHNDAGDDFTDSMVVVIEDPPVLVHETPPGGTTGTTYGYNFTATGFPTPQFTPDDPAHLPTGLTLTRHGRLSGTPTTAGTYHFTVTATNDAGSDVTSTLAVVIGAGGGGGVSPVLVNETPPEGIVGHDYDYAFTATGTPDPDFSVGSGTLPLGLVLSSDGHLSGVPTTSGVYSFSVVADNGVDPPAETPLLFMPVFDLGEGGGGAGDPGSVYITCALIERGEPSGVAIANYFDGSSSPDCLWEQEQVPGKARSYYYKNRAERRVALMRILTANIPLGIGIGEPQFAVLPTPDNTIGMFEPYGSGFYGFGSYGG